MSNVTGRPHGFTPELKEKAVKYVNRPLFETYYKETVIGQSIQQVAHQRPTWMSVAGLALELDVTRQTIYNWADKNHESFNSEFFYIFEQLHKKQELMLEMHALRGDYKENYAKFLAANLTKYKERKEAEQEHNFNITLNYKDE
jgi:tRNA(Ile)-lysidine synthase TilS/MesJ